ncbi:MAG: hypothetical protein JJLCMIEE_02717 [Acidimicrobiales bacterium]|nr:hypothetical protein [Acidimicrobiales bacterium]
MYEDNSRKFAVILNRKHPTGLLLNALGHLSVGIAADLGSEEADLLDYENGAAELTARISRWPVIVLSAKNGNQVRTAYEAALAADLAANVFVTAMLGDSAEAQQRQTAEASPDHLDFVGAALFGSADELAPITKRFSLATNLN